MKRCLLFSPLFSPFSSYGKFRLEATPVPNSLTRHLIMKPLLCIVASLFIASTQPIDPLKGLIEYLSSDTAWEDNGSPLLDLPKSVPTEAIVERVVEMTGAPHIKSYTILCTRKVFFKGPSPGVYTLVLLRTDHGELWIALKWMGGWWSTAGNVN